MVTTATGTLLALGLSTGCSSNLGDFTLLASKNIDLSHFDSQKAENSAPVTGSDTKWFYTFSSPANLKEATDHAEEAGQANSLTNARIVDSYIYVIKDEIDVTGNPVPRSSDAK